jgi:hypothetical protein
MPIFKIDGSEVTHHGLVLEVYTLYDVQIMSDVWDDCVYARVWCPEKGDVEGIFLHDTGSPALRRAVVDATPEVQAAWEALKAKRLEERARREALLQQVEAEEAAKERVTRIVRGTRCVIARGRKYPRNVKGTVTWIGESKFQRGMWNARFVPDTRLEGVGDPKDGGFFIALQNLDRDLPMKGMGQSWQEFEQQLAA